MLKSTILAILAATISSASAAPAVTEPTAVEYATTSKESCSTNQKDYVISDGGCFRLPGKWLAVYRIARTCRVFIYKNEDCTGAEQQVYTISSNQCVNITDYYSIKAFCH